MSGWTGFRAPAKRQPEGRGIGSQVLRDIAANAHGKGINLSVGHKNDRPLKFYHRPGFLTVGKTETHHQLSSGP
jgi:ribosomal protein S18 acetylase RimI-like enzyme